MSFDQISRKFSSNPSGGPAERKCEEAKPQTQMKWCPSCDKHVHITDVTACGGFHMLNGCGSIVIECPFVKCVSCGNQ